MAAGRGPGSPIRPQVLMPARPRSSMRPAATTFVVSAREAELGIKQLARHPSFYVRAAERGSWRAGPSCRQTERGLPSRSEAARERRAMTHEAVPCGRSQPVRPFGRSQEVVWDTTARRPTVDNRRAVFVTPVATRHRRTHARDNPASARQPNLGAPGTPASPCGRGALRAALTKLLASRSVGTVPTGLPEGRPPPARLLPG